LEKVEKKLKTHDMSYRVELEANYFEEKKAINVERGNMDFVSTGNDGKYCFNIPRFPQHR
jgi:hypothetical protein